MSSTPTTFEAVIGLEVHCQLSTESKIFCSCPARLGHGISVADLEINQNTCPVCTAQPGALPVLNQKVVEYAVRAGLATHCKIQSNTVFSRKNYFYPDLPKGYQISQYDQPLCENGYLDLETEQGKKRIQIVRIHLEEDAGKSVHQELCTLVNLNRAGVPLIEIVSAPDLRTSAEAGAYLRSLYAIVTYLGICDGNLQEGNFRCDANVSIRPVGSSQLGTRTELKNINSFRFVEKAIDYEIARQIQLVQSGGRVIQETRLYDSDKNRTESMRSKEEAHDYRYFPEPDLLPIEIESAWIEKIRSSLPELPEQKLMRLTADLGLSSYDAGVLTGQKSVIEFFDRSFALLTGGMHSKADVAKTLANLITGELLRLMNEDAQEIQASQITPQHLADTVQLVMTQAISNTGAKQAIQRAWKSGESIAAIVDQEGLKQVSDLSSLLPAVDKVIAGNPGQVAEYRAGKEKLIGFFVGQVMKETGGKANPALLQELIKKKLSESS